MAACNKANEKYKLLLSPLKVKSVIFKNRIFTCPHGMTQLQDEIPRPTKAYMDHYVNLAKGGAGCVIICNASFIPLKYGEDRNGETGYFNIYGKEHMRYVVEMVDRIHSYGAKACLQQDWHMLYNYTVSDGISLLPMQEETMSKGEMPEEIMHKTADAFADAAEQAILLGFDMFQLHMSSGAMFMQFLSRRTNKRTDQYGGSLENRARFPIMVIDRIRERVGDRILLQVKACGDEGEPPDGLTIEETVGFLKMIQEKVDIIHIAGGTHFTPEGMCRISPIDFEPDESHVAWSRACKEAGIRIPIEANGGLQDPDEMEAILERGDADIISAVRGFIADPDFPNKAYHDRADQIRPCIKCLHCIAGIGSIGFRCSVNPRIGREHLPEDMEPVENGTALAVIGGGPAGMEAALTAAKRGYRVTLFEQKSELGGNTACRKDYYKRSLNKYIEYMIRSVRQQENIELRLNTRVTPETLEKEAYQRVIVAIGAKQACPPIPGAKEYGILVTDYHEKDLKLSGNIVIVGGGISACEAAHSLAAAGNTVTIISRSRELGSSEAKHAKQGYGYMMNLVCFMNRTGRITAITDAACIGMTESSVSYRKDGSEFTISDVDAVILATGMKSLQEEALSLWLPGTMTSLAGDCQTVGNIETAVRTAYDAAAAMG